jgi:hypothetical protein
MDEERLAAIEDAIRELAEVMKAMCEKIDWHDQVLDDLTSNKITDRLSAIEGDFGSMVGGFNDILKARKKGRISEMISGNESLGSYKDRYNKVFKSDLLSDAVDEVMKYLDQEGAGEEGIPGVIEQLVGQLKDRFDEEKAEGEPPSEATGETAAEEKAEHAPGGEEPMPGIEGKVLDFKLEGEGPGDIPEDMKKMARGMRGRAL